ncbi:MAG: RNA polymerase sigma factor, partial [Candidatus Binatia bacterium]
PRSRSTGPSRTALGGSGGRVPEAQSADEKLLALCRAGHRESFHGLVLRYEGRVFTLAFRLLADRGDAEDLTQETFLKAYESLETFRGDSRFSTWLYRICRNLCLNRLARQKNEPLPAGGPSEVLPDPQTRLPERLIAEEQGRIVEWAISRLKPEFREVVALYCTETLSYEEIASSLDVPVGTVRSRLHRGREELKELLRRHLAPEISVSGG